MCYRGIRLICLMAERVHRRRRVRFLVSRENAVIGDVELAGIGESRDRLTNVLVLSTDHLRGDLLETGIRKSENVGVVRSEDVWSDLLENTATVPFEVHVVVIDLGEPEAIERGLESGHDLNRRETHPAIVILAGSTQILAGVRTRMEDVGPRWSFLTFDQIKGLADLARIIDSAAAGMTIVDPGFFPTLSKSDPIESVLTRPLTTRQVEVLELVSQGYNNEGIADRLEITPRTVEYHLNEAYVSIRDCHSAEHNPRVFAARVFSECFGRTNDGGRDSEVKARQRPLQAPAQRSDLRTNSIPRVKDAA